MALLNSLLDRVHDEIPAAPEALALRALSDAVREFCSRTHIWQIEMPRISLRPEKTEYFLYPDEGLQVAAIKELRLDGKRIEPIATELVRQQRRTPQPSAPTHYIQLTSESFSLTSEPVEEDRLTVLAAITLALGSTTVEIPDHLIADYGEAIAYGAKMRLVRQAGQPWFSMEASVLYGGQFYSAITTAKSRIISALGEANMQIEMRSWG